MRRLGPALALFSEPMTFELRFAVYAAVAIASFAAGLSLTTAFNARAKAHPDRMIGRPGAAQDTVLVGTPATPR